MDRPKNNIIRNLLKLPLFGLLATLTVSCGIFQQNLKTEVKSDQYQALFISLQEKTITPVQTILQGDQIVADFWVETQDLEIGTIDEQLEGVPHKGQPTKVALFVDKPYSEITTVPGKLNWKPSIQGSNIEEGLVFLVKASDGKIYKVKLKTFHSEEINLRYNVLEA